MTVQTLIAQTTRQVELVRLPSVVMLSCITGCQMQVVMIQAPCVLRHTYTDGRQITVNVLDDGKHICLMPEGADKALAL